MRFIFSLAVACVGLLSCTDDTGSRQERSTPDPASADSEVASGEKPDPSPSMASGKSTPSPSPKPSPSVAAPTRTKCQPPVAVTANFAKAQDFIDFLNLLPRPLTVPCLLDVLPHPLRITATTSQQSAQPAGGEDNPRFFIFLGPDSKFVLSVVPAGEGSRVIEYSILISDTESIKGEVPFPMTGELQLADVAAHIRRKDGQAGTMCGLCHFNERAAPESYGPNQFISRALAPKSTSTTSAARLRELRGQCVDLRVERCAILDAIFGDTGVMLESFPPLMPHFF